MHCRWSTTRVKLRAFLPTHQLNISVHVGWSDVLWNVSSFFPRASFKHFNALCQSPLGPHIKKLLLTFQCSLEKTACFWNVRVFFFFKEVLGRICSSFHYCASVKHPLYLLSGQCAQQILSSRQFCCIIRGFLNSRWCESVWRVWNERKPTEIGFSYSPAAVFFFTYRHYHFTQKCVGAGRLVAQLVEQAMVRFHLVVLCCMSFSLSLSPLFAVHSSAVLSKK